MLPADLTRLWATRRLRSDYGAGELSLHVSASSYFPGFGHNLAELDALPALSDLKDTHDLTVYSSLCKAGQLQSADDRRWWEYNAISKGEEASSISMMQAATAADYVLRMPRVRKHFTVIFEVLFR